MTNISKIKAGAAKVLIEYPDDFFPYQGFNGRRLAGENDPLFVRTIYLANDTDAVLVISVDNGDLSEAWLPEITEYSGVPNNNIFLTATHTHEAPYLDRTIPERGFDQAKTEQYRENFRKALKKSVLTAMENAVPVKTGFAVGNCPANVNRDVMVSEGHYKTGVNLQGISDHNVYVMKFEDYDGRLVALLTNYAVHSSMMLFSMTGGDGMLASGDLAGAAMAKVESLTGAVSLFTMAPAGDQGPLFTSCNMIISPDGKMKIEDEGTAGYALVRGLGALIGNEVVRVSNSIAADTDKLELKAVTKTVEVPGQKKPEGHPGEPLPKDFVYQEGEPLYVRLGVISLGDTAWAGVAGEIMTGIGIDIRKVLTDHGFKNTMVMTQCNGSNSYMGTDEAYDEHKFAAVASFARKGVQGVLAGGIEKLCNEL